MSWFNGILAGLSAANTALGVANTVIAGLSLNQTI